MNSKGGDLNVHGSAVFNQVFFQIWSNEGFLDYIEYAVDDYWQRHTGGASEPED